MKIEIIDTSYPTNPNFIDHSGEIINNIEIIRYVGKDNYRNTIYECKCHCGKLFNIKWTRINRGLVKSCGCSRTSVSRKDDKYISYINHQFGNLKVIDFHRIQNGTKAVPYFKCECTCGNIVDVTCDHVLGGNTRSCGCLRHIHSKKQQPDQETLSHIGETYNYLTIIEGFRKEDSGGKMRDFYRCKCKCGNIVDIKAYSVLSGLTKSCGCAHVDSMKTRDTSNVYKTHGLYKSELYRRWGSMKSRCYNPSSSRYNSYGGRGIKVCDEWRAYDTENKINTGFINFYNWSVNNGYSEGLSIDRIDVDGNYEPDNCRWVPLQDQYINKQNTIYITSDIEVYDNGNIINDHYTLPMTIWSKIVGISYYTLSTRLIKQRSNWPVKKALTMNEDLSIIEISITNIEPYVKYNRPDKYDQSIHD